MLKARVTKFQPARELDLTEDELEAVKPLGLGSIDGIQENRLKINETMEVQ